MGRIREFFRRLFKRDAKAGKKPAKASTAKPAKAPAKKAPARKPAARTASRKPADKRPQCEALTAAGDQCKRSAREGSKYCGSHKGYRPPAKAATKGAKDTKPTVKAAKDTKPSSRRSQVTKYGYKLYQNGNRYFFSKKAQKDVSGKPVYSMPSGYTTTRTPNGLPVMKKKQ